MALPAVQKTAPLANRVRRRMLDFGISYGDLAEEAGVSLTTMRRIASGESQPRLETALRIARCLESSVGELFFLRSAGADG
ncbi:MAG: XRE family transcriptional regulator [Myxococcales bacterium]|jgi:DNA-binding XRE family transcriptional regulator|nr:MAG: XRE family transcriptional regulator [Myxococcales bacterium]